MNTPTFCPADINDPTPATHTPVTFSELLERLDYVREERDGYVAICPSHPDSNPSLRVSYNPKTRKVGLKCRSGCKTPAVVAALDLAMSNLFNVEPGDLTDLRSVGRQSQEPSIGDIAALTTYVSRTQAAFADDGDDACKYVNVRFGVTEDKALEFGLGYDDGSVDNGQLVLSRAMFRADPRVIVPFLNFDGNPRGLQGRAISGSPKAKWSTPNNPEGSTWAKFGVFRADGGHEDFLICEGPGDGLTAAAAGFDTVFIRGAALGNNAALADELAAGLAGRRVIVAGDADTAGKTFTGDVVSALAARGIDVHRLTLPDGVGDLADWYSATGDTFPAVLAQAVAQAPTAAAEGVGGGVGTGRKRDYDTYSVEDALLGKRIAEEYLRGKWCWSGGLGWLKWDGRRWAEASEVEAQEAVRCALVAAYDQDAAKAGARLAEKRAEAEKARDDALAKLKDGESSKEIAKAYSDAVKVAESDRDKRLKSIRCYFWIGKLTAVLKVAKGILIEDAKTFDAEPYLLNVGNGVVDLRTGKLSPHRPELRFTKITEVNYDPSATHPDWDKALEAMTPDVREWMHLRFGQAATAFPPDDDIVPLMAGGGQNGKSSVLAGVQAAMGEFTRAIPEKVLISNPNDHTTEMTTLLGTRLAILEELPQGRWLDVKRLKAISGTSKITARKIAKDPIEWRPTHSMFITSNYEVRVDENDHGTWRRLVRVPFPYTYGDGPGHLRRMRASAHGSSWAAADNMRRHWPGSWPVRSAGTPSGRRSCLRHPPRSRTPRGSGGTLLTC